MIDRIIASLNEIEVHGKRNIDILLGCIIMLERMRDEQNEKNGDEING